MICAVSALGLETQTVTYEWDRTRFELLDLRGAVLSKFETNHVLGSFAAPSPGNLVVHLTDHRVAHISPDQMWIYEVIDDDRPWSTVEIMSEVGDLLSVNSVVVMTAFQHLVAWPDADTPAQVFRRAAGIVAGGAGVNAHDFALLIDGAVTDEWVYKAEFGIIGRDDARARLLRLVGQIARVMPRAIPSSMFDGREFPAVSTFVDSTWQATLSSVSLPEASDLVSESTEKANTLVEALHKWVHP
jgi:hypothetical protein